MDTWYADLEAAKQYLVRIDPQLKQVFDTVDASGFQLHTIIKAPFPALIGVIIGQKISYRQARALRQKLYIQLGSNFTPHDIFEHRGDHETAPLDQTMGHIIGRVAPSLAAAFGDIAGEEFKDIATDAIQHMGPIVAQAITDDDGTLVNGLAEAVGHSIK